MVSDSSVPSQVAGHHVFSFQLPPTKSFPHTATHYLYVSAHQPRIPTPESSRALFLINIPFDSTVLHIKNLFSHQIGLPAGRIENVQFGDEKENDTGINGEISRPKKTHIQGKKRKRVEAEMDIDQILEAELPPTKELDLHTNDLTAVLIFVDRASMEAALKAVKQVRKSQRPPVWGDGLEDKMPSSGYTRYLTNYKLGFPDKTQLLRSIDTYMTAFAAKEAAEARLQARQRQEPDEDGFVTVTRGGRNNPARQEVAQELAEKQKKKQKGLEDFYRFQSREQRKEKAQELVRKFEQDKEKIRIMKQNRQNFKPQ